MTDISIIIPVYNTEKYIAECLDSVVNSTIFDRCEVIIIDDGSTDNSVKIADKYCNKYDNISLYSYENHGVSFARNKGVEKAVGKYLAFVDSDDVVGKDYIEKLYNEAETKNCEIVFAGFSRFKDTKNKSTIINRNVLDANNVMTGCQYLEKRMDAGDWEHQVWNAIYNRNFIEKNKVTFDENIKVYEDVLFTNEILLLADRVYMIPEYGYFYRNRNMSLTNSNITDFDIGYLISILDKYKNWYETYDKDQKHAIGRASIELLSMLLFYVSDRENKKEYFKKLNSLKLFPMLFSSAKTFKEWVKLIVFKLNWNLFYKIVDLKSKGEK